MDFQREKTILFVKSEEISNELKEELLKMNINFYGLKLLTFEYEKYQKELIEKMKEISNFSALAMNSINGINGLLLAKKTIRSKLEWIKNNNFPIFLVGEKTSKILFEQFDLNPILVGKNLDELFEKIKEYQKMNKIQNFKILYLIGNLSDFSKYENEIKQLGYNFDFQIIYDTIEINYTEFKSQLNEILNTKKEIPNILFFFSPSNVKFFFSYIKLYEKENEIIIDFKNKIYICFGEKTKNELINITKEIKIEEKNIILCPMSNIKDIPIILNKLFEKN